MTYLVFGRRDPQPLEHRGELEAESDGARGAALERYGDDWLELTLVPIACARWVVGTRAETAGV